MSHLDRLIIRVYGSRGERNSTLSETNVASAITPQKTVPTELYVNSPAIDPDHHHQTTVGVDMSKPTLRAPHFDVPLSDNTVFTVPKPQVDTIPVSSGIHSDEVAVKNESAEPLAVGQTSIHHTFGAQWELDHVCWPLICEQLDPNVIKGLEETCHNLVNARQEGARSVAVTSHSRGEGRSTVAICLAKQATEAGIRVALIDLDFQNPQIASQLGLAVEQGLEAVLQGTQTISDISIRSNKDYLVTIPLSTAVDVSDSDCSQLANLLSDCVKQFDLVVYDCGPINEKGIRVLSIGENNPQTFGIVVQDMRITSRAKRDQTIGQLVTTGIIPLGVAQNFLTEHSLSNAYTLEQCQ